MTREEQLARQGWEKRTTYDEPRLSEMAEMYRELGLEVRIEPFDPASQPDCAQCMRQQPERYSTIYVRRPTAMIDGPEGPSDAEDSPRRS